MSFNPSTLSKALAKSNKIMSTCDPFAKRLTISCTVMTSCDSQDRLYLKPCCASDKNTVTWIKSFLKNRNQNVVLEGAKSTSAQVLSGVPQGSVLGPLLFLAYINDNFEFRHFRPHYLDVDTIFGDLGVNVYQSQLLGHSRYPANNRVARMAE
jgi:hypothetical protein